MVLKHEGSRAFPLPRKQRRQAANPEKQFQRREAWPSLLALEPGRRWPQQQALGQGLRRTGGSGAREALHFMPMFFSIVQLALGILLLFYQERHFGRGASFFKRMCSLSTPVLNRKKSGKNNICSLCHILKFVQNMRMGI